MDIKKIDADLRRANELADWLEGMSVMDRQNVMTMLSRPEMIEKLPDSEFTRNIRDLKRLAIDEVPEDHYDSKMPIETRMTSWTYKGKK